MQTKDKQDLYLGFDYAKYLINQSQVQRIIAFKKEKNSKVGSDDTIIKPDVPKISVEILPKPNEEAIKEQAPSSPKKESSPPPKESVPAQNQRMRQSDEIKLRVNKPNMSLCINMVNIRLIGCKVQDIQAQVIVVPYNLKEGFRIYPGPQVLKKQKEIDIKGSIQRRVRDKEDDFVGLKSSNPNFGGYFFVRIDNQNDIFDRLNTVINAIMNEHLDEVAIAYLNNTNSADQIASKNMIDCLINEFSLINPLRSPLKITIFAQTKQKFISLWREFNQRICSGVEQDEIRCV